MDNLLRYTSRDYNSIKDDLLNMINSVNSEWTNREESDPGIMLLSLMSALGDNLSFNMDMQALEMYLSTVTQRKNCKKILQLGGYKMHWYRSAVTEVTIKNNSLNSTMLINTIIHDSDNNLSLISSNGDLNYTLFIPNDLITGVLSDRVVRINPQTEYKFIAVEGRLNSVSIPITAIINNRFYLPETTVDESHIYLYDPSITDGSNQYWTLVEDLNLVTEAGRYFEFNVDEFDNPYIQFVPYWDILTNKDNNSADLQLYYLSSSGSNGNVNANAFSYILSAPETITTNANVDELNYSIANLSNQIGTLAMNNSPGYDPQTVSDAKSDYANYINTYNTLVTLYDFQKFIQRQTGFHIARSIDAQKAQELNEVVFESYNDGTEDEIISTDKQPVPTSQRDWANLCRYRKYVFGGEFTYTRTQINVDKDAVGYSYTGGKTIASYTLNIYTVYLNYDPDYNRMIGQYESGALWNYPKRLKFDVDVGFEEIIDLKGLDVIIDEDSGSITPDVKSTFFGNFNVKWVEYAPFRRYQISDEVQQSLQQKILNTKVITVDVKFPQIRVFDWRAQGTLFLNEPVSELEAESIISIVIEALENKFTPEYVGFGNKIKYMDVIDTINKCDSRISYFDAGYGTKPLIDYADCFDVEHYFNDISIMRYNPYSVPSEGSQDVPQYNMNENGEQLIVIDKSCIRRDDF